MRLLLSLILLALFLAGPVHAADQAVAGARAADVAAIEKVVDQFKAAIIARDGKTLAKLSCASASQTSRAQISHSEELRRHRLPSHVQVKESTAKSHATSRAAAIYHLPRWPSISTQNGIEPA